MENQTLPTELYRSSHYGKVLKKLLPPEAFKPHPTRVFFGLMHMSIVVAMGYLCVMTALPWPVKVLAAIVAGHSWGILGFFAHEIWHGSVFKNGFLDHWSGMAFSLINMSSATAWKIWHNDTHHKHTQVGRVDPDAFPYMDYVRTEPKIRAAQPIIPGYGGVLSYVALTYSWILKYRWATWELLFGRTHGNAKGQKAKIVFETVVMTFPWLALLYAFGPLAMVFLYVIPAMVCSVVNMTYIHSNHHLSPRTPVNDPLINSLTVISHPWIQWFHGNFGFHVEHHIFPSMSVRYARQLHNILREQYGARYQFMPFTKAVRLLYETGTAYADDGERLVDVRTGKTKWTLREGRTDFADAGVVEITPLGRDSVKKRNARDGRVKMDGEVEETAKDSAQSERPASGATPTPAA